MFSNKIINLIVLTPLKYNYKYRKNIDTLLNAMIKTLQCSMSIILDGIYPEIHV